MNKQKSFTLIELLVVIVIIGILAGVIMISTSSSIDKANIAKGQVFSSTVKEELLFHTLAEWTFDNLSQSAGTALPADTMIEDEWGNFDGLSKGNPVVRSGSDCIKGKCLDLSSDWIGIPNFSIGNSVTISFWGKSLNYSGAMAFSFDSDNYVYGPDLYFVGPSVINWNTGDSNSNYIVNTGLPNSNWHHFVLVNDPSNGAKLYIDGVKVGRTASYKNVQTTLSTFFIGRYNYSANYYFNGLLDEFVIYNTALNAKQIYDLYAYYSSLALK